MAAQQLHDGNDDGVLIAAASTDKVGFYGKTPVVKYTTSIATGTDSATTLAAANAVLAVLAHYGLVTINA